jgi:parvulin-like peptidyl-prolyl isomerase
LTNKYSRDFIRASKQSRDITFIKLSPEAEAKKENVSNLEIESFYKDNKYLYLDPKKVSYSFLKVNSDSFGTEDITDEEILLEKEALDQANKIQTRISHIEISYSSGNRQSSLSQLEDIMKLINESPDRFSDLAKEFSSDIGSKNIGGDLGFTDGTLFPNEFEDVIPSLAVGEFSKIIDLGSSFHILKVTKRNKNSSSDEEIKEKINFVKSNEKLDLFLSDVESSIENLNIEKISSDLNLNKSNINSESIANFELKYESLEILEDIKSNNLDLTLTYGPYEIEESFYFFNFTNIEDESFLSLAEVKGVVNEEIKKNKFLDKLDEIINIKKIELLSSPKSFTSYAELQRGNSLLPYDVTDKIFKLTFQSDSAVSVKSSDGDIYIIKLDKINKFNDIVSSEEVENSKIYLDSTFKSIVSDNFNEILKASAKIN